MEFFQTVDFSVLLNGCTTWSPGEKASQHMLFVLIMLNV